VDIRRNDFYSEKSHEIDNDTICNCTFNIDTKIDAMDTRGFCSALSDQYFVYSICRMYLCVCVSKFYMCMLRVYVYMYV